MADSDDSFVSRWSRRKSEAGEGLRRKGAARVSKPAPLDADSRPEPAPETPAGDPVVQEKAVAAIDHDLTLAGQIRAEEDAAVVPVNQTPAAQGDEDQDEEKPSEEPSADK